MDTNANKNDGNNASINVEPNLKIFIDDSTNTTDLRGDRLFTVGHVQIWCL